MGDYGPVRSAPQSTLDTFSPYAAAVPADQEEEIATLWVGNALPGTTDGDLAAAFAQFGTMVTCFLRPKLSPNGFMSGFVRYSTRDAADMALVVVNHGHVVVKGATITAKWADRNSNPTSGAAWQAVQQSLAAGQLQQTPDPAGFQHDAVSMQQSVAVLQDPALKILQGIEGVATAAPTEELATLWIGNAVIGTTDAELLSAFSLYGSLLACFLLKKMSPNGQLSGFVRYSTAQEASAALLAVESGFIVINGATITAKWATRNTGITKALVNGSGLPAT